MIYLTHYLAPLSTTISCFVYNISETIPTFCMQQPTANSKQLKMLLSLGNESIDRPKMTQITFHLATIKKSSAEENVRTSENNQLFIGVVPCLLFSVIVCFFFKYLPVGVMLSDFIYIEHCECIAVITFYSYILQSLLHLRGCFVVFACFHSNMFHVFIFANFAFI